MRMIIVLDKICLAGVIGLSLLIGYKVGYEDGSKGKMSEPNLYEVGKE